MATRTTPEEKAKKVLEIYAHFDSQPGHVLRASNFVAVATRWRIRMTDIQQGLEYAARLGWIEETEDGSLRLTDRGFSAMPQPTRAS